MTTTNTTDRKAEFLAIDRLWKLLEFALQDYEACKVMQNVEFDMSNWVDMRYGVCYVCLAGSVLVNTFKVTADNDNYTPLSDLAAKVADTYAEKCAIIDRCRTIDFLRTGYVVDAFIYLYGRSQLPHTNVLYESEKLNAVTIALSVDEKEFNYKLLTDLANVLKELDL